MSSKIIAFLVVVGVAICMAEDWYCGAKSQKFCTGAYSGQCCSQYGACGTSDEHCGVGCQTRWGKCNPKHWMCNDNCGAYCGDGWGTNPESKAALCYPTCLFQQSVLYKCDA